MRVKICGIRSIADLRISVAAGANALGFLVGLTHTSEDKLDAVDARRLIRSLPPFVQPVMVTHLTSPQEITDLAGFAGAHAIQLHGDMSPLAVCEVRRLRPAVSVIRAIHVLDESTVSDIVTQVTEVSSAVDAVLLDSRTADRLGGTGKTHNWALSRKVVTGSPVPVILAGGLTPANVGIAVRQVKPFAVDVNSGVETATGDKSPALCEQFIAAARARSSRGRTGVR